MAVDAGLIITWHKEGLCQTAETAYRRKCKTGGKIRAFFTGLAGPVKKAPYLIPPGVLSVDSSTVEIILNVFERLAVY